MLGTITTYNKFLDSNAYNKLFSDITDNELDLEYMKLYKQNTKGQKVAYDLNEILSYGYDMLQAYMDNTLQNTSLIGFAASKALHESKFANKENKGRNQSLDFSIDSEDSNSNTTLESIFSCETNQYDEKDEVLDYENFHYYLKKLKIMNDDFIMTDFGVDIVLLLKRALQGIFVACRKLEEIINQPGMEDVSATVRDLLVCGKDVVDYL